MNEICQYDSRLCNDCKKKSCTGELDFEIFVFSSLRFTRGMPASDVRARGGRPIMPHNVSRYSLENFFMANQLIVLQICSV